MNIDEFLYGVPEEQNTEEEDESVPTSFLIYPLKANFDTQQNKLVGALVAVFSWETFFTLEDHHDTPTIQAVIDDGCGEAFTMNLTGRVATFVGNGNIHDRTFDRLVESFRFAPFLRTDHSNATKDHEHECQFVVSLYPTQEFYEVFQTKSPVHIPLVIVGIIFFGLLVFCLYDLAVHSRQRRILAIAAQSERILSVLYPKQIRDRLFGGASGLIGGATSRMFGANQHHNKEDHDDDEDHSGSGQNTAETLDNTEDGKAKRNGRERNKKTKSKNVNKMAPKHQLKSFMNEDSARRGKMKNHSQESLVLATKPIADLFPNTTVST